MQAKFSEKHNNFTQKMQSAKCKMLNEPCILHFAFSILHFHGSHFGFGLGQRQSDGLQSTRMMSSPTRLMAFQGIT